MTDAGYSLGFVSLNDDVSASVNSVFGRTGAVAASVGDYVAAQVTHAADKSSGSAQVFAAELISPSVGVVTFASAPPAAASVAMSIGSALQNTLGYDALLTTYIKITAAAAATILVGVGPTSTPLLNPYISSDSLTGVTSISLWVPAGYYAQINTSGTITNSITAMWCPA